MMSKAEFPAKAAARYDATTGLKDKNDFYSFESHPSKRLDNSAGVGPANVSFSSNASSGNRMTTSVVPIHLKNCSSTGKIKGIRSA